MADLLLSVTPEEFAALDYMASRYAVTVPAYVVRQLTDFLAETVRNASTVRWEARKRLLEGDAALAATVDAAGTGRLQAPRRQGRTVTVQAPRRRRR